MFSNYFKVAFRQLMQNKLVSTINILGLSIGLTISMFILLFVMHEMAYDNFHVNGSRIFKVMTEVKMGDQTINIEGLPSKLAPMMKESNSNVLDFARIGSEQQVIFINPEIPALKFKEGPLLFADPSFFKFFSFKLIAGGADEALASPFSLVISEEAAKKYFGDQNPIGKSLLSGTKQSYTITGVMEDIPSNSTLQFDFISSIETFPKLNLEKEKVWEKAGAFQTFLLLQSEQNAEEVAHDIKTIGAKTNAFDTTAAYSLKQYSSQHLGGGFSQNTNARYVYIFGGISLLILFLAIFNYVSLATARSTSRAKEVGVRKVVGGSQKQLIIQFYLESFLVCSIAFGLAMMMTKLFLIPFYELVGVKMDTPLLTGNQSLLFLSILYVISIALAGSYPALLLSRFIPMEVIRGKFSSGQGGAAIRKGITVFQFVVSIALVFCVIITQKQMKYLKQKDLGFVQSQVVALPISGSMITHFIDFKNKLSQMPGVKSITSSTSPFYKGYNAWFTQSVKSKKDVFLYTISADENFFTALGIPWTKEPIDTFNIKQKLFINETAVQELELDNNPIGQYVELGDSKQEVGGVFKNFHFTGVRETIKPLAINIYPESKIDWKGSSSNPTVYLRFVSGAAMAQNLSNIKLYYDQYQSESPFEYYFLDEAFYQTFADENRLSKIFAVFSGLAIFISSIGLFGLITMAAETRTKEIGIRKILGASIHQISLLISADFIKLVVLAYIIASPVAVLLMNNWLHHFAIRIKIDFWTFLLTALMACLIAVFSMSFQVVRAGISKPVNSLRNE